MTLAIDTEDAATAASFGIEGTCAQHGFRAAGGAACTFPPPDLDPGRSCARTTFVAPAGGPCTVTVGVRRLDAGLSACHDAQLARYRLTVGGRALALTADDTAPGLSE